MTLVDPSSCVDEYLRLEALAAEPYNSFVYSSTGEAYALARYCFDAGAGEAAPPYGQAVIDDDRVVAMISFLDGAQLKSARTCAAMCLVRGTKIDPDGPVRERMWLAGETLVDVAGDDLYLSRIAVSEAARGVGIARGLMASYELVGRAAGKRRLVLEVSPSHEHAVALYTRCGFAVFGEHGVSDPASNRELVYLHMAKILG